jgi:hypothetical protein
MKTRGKQKEKEEKKKEKEELGSWSERLQSAKNAVKGGCTAKAAALQFKIDRKALGRHIRADEVHSPAPTVGRPLAFTTEEVAFFRDEAAKKDLEKDSKDTDDWSELLQKKFLAKHPSASPPGTKTLHKYVDQIVPDIAPKADRQTEARRKALVELYNGISFVVAARLAFSFTQSKSLSGVTKAEATSAELIFNVDASSTYLGKGLDQRQPVRLAAGSKKKLKELDRSAGSTKKEEEVRLQKRMIHYQALVSGNELKCFVVHIADKAIKAIDLFKLDKFGKYFLIISGLIYFEKSKCQTWVKASVVK